MTDEELQQAIEKDLDALYADNYKRPTEREDVEDMVQDQEDQYPFFYPVVFFAILGWVVVLALAFNFVYQGVKLLH